MYVSACLLSWRINSIGFQRIIGKKFVFQSLKGVQKTSDSDYWENIICCSSLIMAEKKKLIMPEIIRSLFEKSFIL